MILGLFYSVLEFNLSTFFLQIPDSKIFIGAAGMDVALNMPQTKMNLGSMPAMTATLNTDASDLMHAIILPVISCSITVEFRTLKLR